MAAAVEVPQCETCGHRHVQGERCKVCGHVGKAKVMRALLSRAARHQAMRLSSVEGVLPRDSERVHLCDLLRMEVMQLEGERHSGWPMPQEQVPRDSLVGFGRPAYRHVLAMVGDAPAGTLRWVVEAVALDGEEMARSGVVLGGLVNGAVVAVVDAVCVLEPFRRKGIAGGMLDQVKTDLVQHAETGGYVAAGIRAVGIREEDTAFCKKLAQGGFFPLEHVPDDQRQEGMLTLFLPAGGVGVG